MRYTKVVGWGYYLRESCWSLQKFLTVLLAVKSSLRILDTVYIMTSWPMQVA
jgi:hypothetical protein